MGIINKVLTLVGVYSDTAEQKLDNAAFEERRKNGTLDSYLHETAKSELAKFAESLGKAKISLDKEQGEYEEQQKKCVKIQSTISSAKEKLESLKQQQNNGDSSVQSEIDKYDKSISDLTKMFIHERDLLEKEKAEYESALDLYNLANDTYKEKENYVSEELSKLNKANLELAHSEVLNQQAKLREEINGKGNTKTSSQFSGAINALKEKQQNLNANTKATNDVNNIHQGPKVDDFTSQLLNQTDNSQNGLSVDDILNIKL